MVAKIIHGTSIYGALAYNQKKVDDAKGKVIFANKVIQDYPSGNISMINALTSFEPYLIANRRTKKPVIHISLNPDPKDKLNERDLSILAQDYMDKLGYKDQPYIVFQHNDIDRTHLHVVSVNVDENGVKIDDSFEKLKSMDICRELEVKYKLNQLPEEKLKDKLYLKKLDYSQGEIKQQMSSILQTVFQEYIFQSFGELNALLSCFNIDIKHVKGEDANNQYNGIIYSPMNNEGKIVGNPIKSSRFGKNVGFEAINKLLSKTNQKVKEKGMNTYQVKNNIMNAMKSTNNINHFSSLLRKCSIDVVFRQNAEGRIYGVTFIDHQNKIVCNGSRLGKEFSANVFNKHFSSTHNISNNILNADNEKMQSSDHSLIYVDNIFGTFSPGSTGFYAEEEEFIRKMKKKKRRMKQ